MLARALTVVAVVLAVVACSQPAAPTQAPAPAQSAPTPAAKAPPAAPTQPAEPVVVRVGLQGGSSDAAAFIADARGYFREQGIQFEHVPFSAPPAMVAPLATSQIDVAGVGPNPQYVNAVACDVPIKAVADKGRFSRGGGYIAFAVRKALVDEGRYRGPADLKGLRIALAPPAMTSPTAIDLDILLQRGGLTLEDVELIDLPTADMAASLAGGSIDGAMIAEPFASRVVEMGAAMRILGLDEVNPDQQIAAISYAPAFMADKPDVARRFVVAYIKGARAYNDAFLKNRGKAEIIQILAQATTIKEPAVWEKAVPPGINPDGYVNADSLVDQLDWYYRHGQIVEQRDVAEMIDHQYVDYAIGVLGRYQ
jgi:NitT/TauT family transport system substrate-binding protein